MPVQWKKSSRFKPEILLKKIAEVRTVSPKGGSAFHGLAIEEYLPTLQSMLVFPDVATEADLPTLIWRGLSRLGQELEPKSFLDAVNAELSQRLAKKEESYQVLTSLSLVPKGLPRKLRAFSTDIILLPGSYSPRLTKTRSKLLSENHIPASPTPQSYCKVAVRVRAKSSSAAFHKAAHTLDLVRAILCLMCNKLMEISLLRSGPSKPINAIRTGSVHTLHKIDGSAADPGIWYEPWFSESSLHTFTKPEIVTKNLKWSIRRLQRSSYGQAIVASLVRFVRALDERDPDVAFIRLWGALEGLLTPELADYDKLVRRCAFLLKESSYHSQVLEHLRECRNASVHAGEQSDVARTHCYQLQMYYVTAAWFHIRNATYFLSQHEANTFLDSPTSSMDLKRRMKLIRRAYKFAASDGA